MTQAPRLRQDPQALRRIRQRRGMKSGELAALVRLSPKTLQNGESGCASLSMEALYRVAGKLNVDITTILSEQGREELEKAGAA